MESTVTNIYGDYCKYVSHLNATKNRFLHIRDIDNDSDFGAPPSLVIKDLKNI